MPVRREGKVRKLRLDDYWKEFHRESFFLKLMAILRGDKAVSSGWRTSLWNAAILTGQSQSSRNQAFCFLRNMVALELLLTKQGDTYINVLPERAEAFIGWATSWQIENYEERIREVYKKRCRMVHEGVTDGITIEDLLFTDDLLLNLFENIALHPELFSSKKAVVEFAERCRAERLLGVKAKVRPKTLRFVSRQYSLDDYDEI